MTAGLATMGQAGSDQLQEGHSGKEALPKPDRSVIAAFAKACKRAAALLGDGRGAEAIEALRHARRVLGLVRDEYRRCGRYGHVRRIEQADRYLVFAEKRVRAERMSRAPKLVLRAEQLVAGRRKGGKDRKAAEMSA